MIDFLIMADYLVYITKGALDKIIRDNNTKVTDCERMAYGYVYEKLSNRFNLDKEIQKKAMIAIRHWSVGCLYWLSTTYISPYLMKRFRSVYDRTTKM